MREDVFGELQGVTIVAEKQSIDYGIVGLG